MWTVLSTTDILNCRQRFTECGKFVKVSVWLSTCPLGCQRYFASGRIQNGFWFLIQIQRFLVFFSSGTPCLYKKGLSPCNCTLYLIDLIRSLSFCFNGVGNCRISLNSCVLAFFLLFACSCDWWLFSGVNVLCCWDSYKCYQSFPDSTGSFVWVEQIALELQFRLDVKIWSFLFEFVFTNHFSHYFEESIG